MNTKICNKCKKEKLITEFYYKKRTKDNLDTICKDCNKEYQKLRANTCIKHEPVTEGSKKCIICGEIKDINDFCVDRRLASGRTNRCKKCDKSYRDNYKKQNIDKVKEYNKHYNNQIINKICVICGDSFKSRRDGTNYCPKCHNSKRTLPELKFSNLLEKYDIEFQSELYLANKYNYDFYLPKYNLLVEISPTFSHSLEPCGYISKGKDRLYHFNKVNTANELGYDCINVWDCIDYEKLVYKLKTENKLNIIKRNIIEHNIDGLTLVDDGQDIEGVYYG